MRRASAVLNPRFFMTKASGRFDAPRLYENPLTVVVFGDLLRQFCLNVLGRFDAPLFSSGSPAPF